MATIGDVLKNPEAGWRRYDDRNSLIYYTEGHWDRISNLNSYKDTYMGNLKDSPTNGRAYMKFNFFGTKFLLLGLIAITYSKDIAIEIDGEKSMFSAYGDGPISGVDQTVFFIKENLELKMHTVKIWNTKINAQVKSYNFRIDAIDIDSDGELLPELSREYEFPIAVIEEEEVAGYAGSLINGEEQLLITPTGNLYLTNGNKSYIECGGNQKPPTIPTGDIIKFNIARGKGAVLSNNDTTCVLPFAVNWVAVDSRKSFHSNSFYIEFKIDNKGESIYGAVLEKGGTPNGYVPYYNDSSSQVSHKAGDINTGDIFGIKITPSSKCIFYKNGVVLNEAKITFNNFEVIIGTGARGESGGNASATILKTPRYMPTGCVYYNEKDDISIKISEDKSLRINCDGDMFIIDDSKTILNIGVTKAKYQELENRIIALEALMGTRE